MAHTSSTGFWTMISPAMRRELGDVFSIRTATSSQESSSSVPSSAPPNHHTFSAVVDDEYDGNGDAAVEAKDEVRLFRGRDGEKPVTAFGDAKSSAVVTVTLNAWSALVRLFLIFFVS